MRKISSTSALVLAVASLATAAPANAVAQVELSNDLSKCRKGSGPAMLVTVTGVKASTGKIRVQSYRANASEWMAKGRWINRIEAPARAGTMTFCVPLPAAGNYGIAIRHDVNGNGSTDLTKDGGGISNNPSINIFNLGKPKYSKAAVPVGQEVKSIFIDMRYM